VKVETQKLLDAFDKRIQADYGFDIAVTSRATMPRR